MNTNINTGPSSYGCCSLFNQVYHQVKDML